MQTIFPSRGRISLSIKVPNSFSRQLTLEIRTYRTVMREHEGFASIARISHLCNVYLRLSAAVPIALVEQMMLHLSWSSLTGVSAHRIIGNDCAPARRNTRLINACVTLQRAINIQLSGLITEQNLRGIDLIKYYYKVIFVATSYWWLCWYNLIIYAINSNSD